jgi:hypothetical protein
MSFSLHRRERRTRFPALPSHDFSANGAGAAFSADAHSGFVRIGNAGNRADAAAAATHGLRSASRAGIPPAANQDTDSQYLREPWPALDMF